MPQLCAGSWDSLSMVCLKSNEGIVFWLDDTYDCVYFYILGAIPVTTGLFSSTNVPLLSISTAFNCAGNEASLLECGIHDEICVKKHAGVFCQG